MSLIKCDKCGEMFSETYKKCPFCVEDEEFYNGKVKKFNRRKVEKKHKSPSIIGPAMIVILLILVLVLVWSFFGEDLRALFGDMKKANEENTAPTITQTEPQKQPEKPEEVQIELIAIDPTILQMKVGESETLTVSGADSYSWLNSDPSVISITEKGLVTALAEGNASVTVTDKEGNTAVCAITVAGEKDIDPEENKPEENKPEENKPEENKPEEKPTQKPSNLKLGTIYGPLSPTSDGTYDITMGKGETLEMTIDGTSEKAAWSSSDSSVVTVSENGTLKASKSGQSTVKAKVGSTTIEVLVRVN